LSDRSYHSECWAAIKADKRLSDMALVKYSRLSVQPVTADEWKIVCKMGAM
jgi:predicted RNA-binding protein with PUA-like domain